MKIFRGWSVLFLTFVLAASGQSPSASADHDYLIGPLDVLNVEVFQQVEFTRAVAVRPDGKITLPLIEDVQAAGLTPKQLAAEITKLLAKYVSQPRVSVIVAQINSKVVYIGGEVNHPGTLPLLANMTVLQAIFLGGGVTQYANTKKIYVMRTENGKQVHYPFNYKKAVKSGKSSENIPLKEGDTIVVP
jgi:polysaccharide export outer membrane protein